ncbi:hypothetical protein GJAV_G00052880 [Gymnothorax javanicus]|nr:hypothetical protein GJAV_G00052880 [Gymnothorax javanicus]
MRTNNPRIPYNGPIPGGLRPGMSIYFKGTVPNNVNRFAFNLMIRGHVAMHFNPRFRGWSGVVFNTRKGGWQREERTRQPFRKGEDFEVLFTVTSEGYQVDVNGEHLHLYKHRMPAQKVNALRIGGIVSLETIIIGEEGLPGKTLSVPHFRTIDGGLKVGMSLIFKGMVHHIINRFHINLKCREERGGAKALHFNPRFKHGEVVVLNSFQHGRWQGEERPAGMPFTKGGIFELVFNVTSEGYQVIVDGKDFHLFKHRIPVERVCAIRVSGDVSLQSIDIIEVKQHLGPIYGGLRPGMSVYFKGTVPEESHRFSINLHCGESKGCNNAFHFNPRFDSNVVVFNTFRNGHWENEERSSDMRIKRGEDFELLFIITSEGYQVNINGTNYYLFKHRMEVEDVTAIKIFGDVKIETRNIIESIPHLTTIHGGLKVGMRLYFRGTVHDQIKRFHINLQKKQKSNHGIALHFNPRFKPRPVVVFNTLRLGWGREERVHDMPFSEGEDFELVVIVMQKGYQVNVNGRQYYMFKHRIPAKQVNFIKVAGDVSMETIDIIGGGEEDSRGLWKMAVTKIPHIGRVSGGLRTGMHLYFRGSVPKDLNRFAINLQYGRTSGCDKALHFNPRFKPSEVVVFNTFQNGKWEHEERVNKMPFTKGEDFELVFIITAQGYQVIVNGRQLYFFKHRMAVEQVSDIKIGGEVSMQGIEMIRGVQGALLGHPSLGKMVVTKIPHVGPIFGGLRTGMTLFFRGTVPQDIKRFHINLQYGQMKGSDKALHFNPRFEPHEVVVFNSFRNGKWEHEERPSEMPFRKGEDFELVFIITAEGYQVNVNGREFHLFRHRMPLEHVGAVKIAGDVSMKTVNMTEAGKAGMLSRKHLGKMVVSSIPFVGPIHGCLRKGMYLYFRGTVPQDVDRFGINLQYGKLKGCDKALHFNPRFKPHEMVVFNTFKNGRWQRETRVHRMPFCRGEDFELVFIVNARGYQVIVNGRPFHLFRHRMPVEQVSALKIGGDVSIEEVNLLGSIPHVGPILGGLRTGMFLFFRGTVPQDLDRFAINLQYGQKLGCDTALHFNPRFKPRQLVVLNSFRNGKWEREERVNQMPFTKGEDFEISFIVTPKGYQVIVNGHQFHLFKHRMPVEHVSALKIGGEVSIQSVNIVGGDDDDDDDQEVRPTFGRMAITKIPHVGPIHRGLRMGMALCFQGTVPTDINRFAINLQYGQKAGSDIAMHFNPRFKPYEVVVFNTFRKGRWEREERPKEMPFRKGEDFELVFLITAVGYQVIVDGRNFHLFKHRMPVENVSALKIAGDVSMETVETAEGKEYLQENAAVKEILSVPYLKPIEGNLKMGTTVFVKGTVPSKSHRFSINLYCSDGHGADNALHFNPRFDSNVVVFNTFRKHWENEERPGGMPFKRGDDFEVFIIATSEGFQVNVNGTEFYLFKHRMPVEKVNAIKIMGDVSLHDVDILPGEELIVCPRPPVIPGIEPILPVCPMPRPGPEIKEPCVPECGMPPAVKRDISDLGPLHGGLRPGMSVYFRGTVPKKCFRFSLNLFYGDDINSDIAFHFNPRFDSNLVVLNSRQNGGWANEKRPSGMPFQKGEDFEVVFNVTTVGYQVNVNGNEFCKFKHRLSAEKVYTIKVLGDVSVQTINIIKTIPYKGPIFGGIRKGMYLYFRGTVHDDANRFHINLQVADKKGCNKALHFNPRFKPHQLVVFNSFQNGHWQREERVHETPFRKGEDFEVVFIVTPKGYQVLVNGRRFYMFKHRIPVGQVGTVAVAGDVSMASLSMIGKIPHMGPIFGGLRAGMCIYFRGTIPHNINRFAINLQYGQMIGSDVALHFNPRFKPHEVVVFNTFKNGSWENEERPGEMPFRKGEDFELVFFITAEGYQVNVNGRQFHLFKHRMPVEHVGALKIAGDISMKTVNMIGGAHGDKHAHPGLGKMIVTKIPHVGPVYGGLRPGMCLFFKGTVPQDIKRFHINLQFGQTKGCDKALHFNPRFEPHEVVVFNSFRKGSWENEERPSEMPFAKGEDFELVFFITPEGYQVNVNGRQFHLFKHRMPVEQVNAVKIAGDVSMQTVNMTATIPHSQSIKGGLRKGMYLYFKGTVPQDIKRLSKVKALASPRFHINLQYGQKKGSDKVLHFNPRFEPNEVVVFNSFKNGSWENEERPSEMPFRKGEDFEVIMFVTSEGYQVNVNGREFHLFKHRMPFQQVSALKVAGDVSMKTIKIVKGGYPGLGKVVVSKIPHVGPVIGGLRPGMCLYFRGTVPQEIKRFHINLACGKKTKCDKALHFNPRFEPSEVVVFNSFRNGGWENEERPSEMPFRRGEDFELVFFVTREGYQVNVNGRQFHFFKHRLPVKHVSAIKIAGDVSVQTIDTVMRTHRGQQGRPGLGRMVISKIPHVGPVHGGLSKGMVLSFRGTVPQKINRFHINLQYGESKGCDKALHFNPRFKPSEVVVLNTFRNGKWEREERVDEMPFQRGENFELVFFVTAEGYQVNVNGREYYLFKHRMPLEQVSAIKIAGDVSMETADISEGDDDDDEQPKKEKEEKKRVPSIPKVGPIFGGLRPGMTLHFQGTIPEEVDRFSINLHCGDEKGCDNAFHFNPRFEPSDVVVFNTFRNGSWESEERVEDMPFQAGDSFEMDFNVTAEGYQVNVNDKEFYLFKHRIPMEAVTAVKVYGDVAIQTVNVMEGGIGKTLGRLGQGKMVVDSIPFVQEFQHHLRVGTYLYFRGKVDEDINRFHINLQTGDAKNCAKALHFNPRFQPHEVVVLNSFQHGRWQREERVGEMPFRRGESFELVIIVTSKGYQVIVNGRRFHMFKHRIAVERVSALKIAGDVSIKSIDMNEGGVPGYGGLRKMAVPKIPYVGPVFGGLRPGMYLYFRGTVPAEIKRFHINLQYGHAKGSDKVLHFNPRFEPSEVVVFNSFRNNGWQREERPNEMPFTKGEDFELVFFITAKGIQVNANGRQFHLFKHRMPVEHVSAVKIAGDVTIQTFRINEGGKGGIRPSLGKMTITSIPHVGPVYGGLRTGMFVFFRGTVPQDIKRFHINLQYGKKKGCDKALHFNPRFEPHEVVVFNSFRNGKWENEERPGEMPFRKGEDFELVFIITAKGFQVNVNGRRFHLFKHRMPVEQVSTIKIAGDVSMKTVDMTEGGQGIMPLLPAPGTVDVIPTPHMEPISGGLRPGAHLYFRGTVPQESKQFAINLKYGHIKGADKALHFNPRLDSNVVVFNTFENGKWQNEERPSEMPFTKGGDFEVVFIVTSEGYQVNVNGRHFYLFKHRMPAKQVCAVKIVGDVSMQKINITEGGLAQPGLAKNVISAIPHVQPTYGGLRPGMCLYFKGTVPQEIKRFHINLQYGELKGCDKALHFNPRFEPHEVVVFNSFKNGSWENEERPSEMPFRKGEDFELVFFITAKGFQVNVNGRQFHFFKHRMPVEHISAIKIAGDVSMKTLNTIEGGQDVEELPNNGKIAVNDIPHVGPIYGGLRPGMALFFQGTIPNDITRFAINLQYGKMGGCDRALHFNPRFGPSKTVVFNTFRNGGWENEERVDRMPFKRGEDFELAFVITSKGYLVVVNGRRFHLFKHRMPVEQVSALKISGGVFIESANIMKREAIEIKGKPAEETKEKPTEETKEKPDEEETKEKPTEETKEKPTEETKEKPTEEETKEKPDEETKEKPDEEETKEKPIEETKEKPTEETKEKPTEETKEKPDEEETESLPEEEVVSGDLKAGMAVYMKGTLPSEISSFAINLRCGDDKNSDIALHFNARFEPKETVVFNSFRNGSWENVEALSEMPFHLGESFELVFHVLAEEYKVYVARRCIYSFKHRIPVEQVTSVQVIGEVSMQVANFIDIAQVVPKQADDEDDDDDDETETTQTMMSVPGSLKAGLSMSFQGTVPADSSSFSIDLQCGDSAGCDTALHFKPKFASSEVVFNSYQNGSWGTEEKVTEMPFTKGESFLLVFMLKEDGYQVNLNARPVYMFKHRIALENVRTLKIAGDVSIQNVNIVEMVVVGSEEAAEEEETVQCEAPLPGCLKTQTSLTFEGEIPEDTKSFSINLQSGDSEGSDIAFHFSPRFETTEVVFNTFQNGSWQTAEKVDSMPFTRGEKFVLVYIITTEGYQVNVNGAEFYLYKHRIPLEQVKILQIAGDVSVPTIDVTEGAAPECPSPADMGAVQSEIPIPNTLKPWVTMSFQGKIPDEANMFCLNFQCGEEDGCDTALHFCPRLDTSEVIFNTFQNGSWESAEKVAAMPFAKGENFELAFSVTAEGFQVNVNGQPLHMFKHRMDVQQVAALQIIGDVCFMSINIIESAPSVMCLPSGLKAGTAMTFLGTIPAESTRFSIDLQCGEEDGSEVAFQLHPLFEPSEVVTFNSFKNGSWEQEERATAMPFRRGEDFELVYEITPEGYKVSVNGQSFYLFNHRIPVEEVKALKISGNVSVPSLNIVEAAKYTIEETTTVETVACSAPVVVPVPGGFKAGTSVTFTGAIPLGIPSFSIDLQCGEADGCDTALHLSSQYEPSEAMVLNSFQNGSWESEQRIEAMPLHRGENFELVLNITSAGYQVVANGTELPKFMHRIPLEQVVALRITGDISIQNINILEGAVVDAGEPVGCGLSVSVSGSLGDETLTCGIGGQL